MRQKSSDAGYERDEWHPVDGSETAGSVTAIACTSVDAGAVLALISWSLDVGTVIVQETFRTETFSSQVT